MGKKSEALTSLRKLLGANEAVKYRGRKARLLEGMLFDIHTLVTSAKE